MQAGIEGLAEVSQVIKRPAVVIFVFKSSTTKLEIKQQLKL